jgi:hypothetical protein
MTGILKIVTTTDFGADCDDQKAVADAIEGLGAGEEMGFIVSGPHPAVAAAAIAEKYFLTKGHYPLIGLGQQFEKDQRPENQIYSLVDGSPMIGKVIAAVFLTPEEFQRAVDAQIRTGKLATLETVVLAPLHSPLEYYNPARPELAADADFQEKWARIAKTSTTQFQRLPDGSYQGNNYLKSAPGVADGFLAMLDSHHVEQLYFDGAVAKAPEFLMPVEQARHPGFQKAFESYIATMQANWLYMTEDAGVTPGAAAMHAGMFTPGARFPFGVHVAKATPAGFGLERALRETCGISRGKPVRYAAAKRPILDELEAFDVQVLAQLQKTHPEIATVEMMRAEMHRGMMQALQGFAQKNGLAAGETVASFTELFDRARGRGIKLNPYAYMEDFAAELFAASPVTAAITQIAEAEINAPRDETGAPRVAGKTHAETLAGALGALGAHATVYDAVAVAAGKVVRASPGLKSWFAEAAGGGKTVLNVTQDKVRKLQAADAALYAVFRDGITAALSADGSILAKAKAKRGPKPV